MLEENEYILWQIETEQGKFVGLHEQVLEEEEEQNKQRRELAEQRAQKEEISILQAQRRHKREMQKDLEDVKERELRHRKTMEDAQKSHEIAVQFLKESISRVHQKEAKEELKTREDMQKRMQNVLNLKNSIAASRENIRVRQAWHKKKAAEAKKQELEEKESVLSDGGNVTQHIHQQKRLKELERQKQALEEQQKLRKAEILSRILQEEAYMEKTKKESSKSWDKIQGPSKLRSKALQYVEKTCREKPEQDREPIQKKWHAPSVDGDSTTEHAEEKREELEEEQDMIAEPEFIGLWNQDQKPYTVLKSDADSKPLGGSKMEKEILAKTLEKLRNGIIQKQVAAGHEFKGSPFYSKPAVIHFKDFDVGKTYKKKVILTNASYSINYCRLMGVSEELKDFIHIHFDPPGQMSAGMSCDMMVTFKPMINEELDGEVLLSSQIGRFSVPLKCTIKKCELAVDKEFIDFGTHVVGETILRTITLTNQGALGTTFHLQMPGDVEAMHLTAGKSSLGRVASFDSIGAISEDMARCSSVEPGARYEGKSHLSETSIKSGRKMKASRGTSEPASTPKPSSPEAGGRIGSPSGEIKLGEVTNGEIEPFSSVNVQIIFSPLIPGEIETDFEIAFDDPDCKSIPLRARGAALDLPVWVPRPNIDLKICMYDRLYQDSIMIQNRERTALRLKFEVCKLLKPHMEVLPKTGYIQAQSSLSIQLKFLPRQSLPQDAGEYFDKDTGVLEAPLTILVASQTKPILLTVHAIITSSDLEINPTEVDFGHCTIYEAVTSTVQITNKSILPQDFGFVGVPEFVEIQPNDGFGTLLPLESVRMEIIFKAKKAKEYKVDLICKTAINRQFKVLCKAIGVHPPLALSHSLVRFAATALNDISTAILYVINSHISRNDYTHDVPRIGKGEIAPVGPTSFEFHVPEDSSIDIVPSVGTVWPGEKCLVRVSFRPTLSEQSVKEEAVRMLQRAAEAKALLKKESVKEMEMPSKKEKREAKTGRKTSESTSPKLTGRTSPKHSLKEKVNKMDLPKPDDIRPDSDIYFAALTAIFRTFQGRLERHIVPCFVATCRDASDPRKSSKLNYSPYNTLFLELCCPTVAPPIIIISDNGRSTISFGEVAVGQRVLKRLTIQNISQEALAISYSILNPLGPFVILSAVTVLEPGGSSPLIISFSPQESKMFFENLDVRSSKDTLRLNVTGQGLTPSVTCSVEDGLINMGYVLANDSVTTTFKLQNVSAIALQYTIGLDSLLVTRHKDQQKRPSFLASDREASSLVGTQNLSGLSVFSVTPVEGILEPGVNQEFTVTFNPDHESLYYSDCLRVELFSKQIAHVIQLKGAATTHLMFVEGGDPMDVSFESLTITPTYEDSTKESEEQMKPVLVKLQCVQTQGLFTPAFKEIYVGAIRTSQIQTKKNVEFSFDNLPFLIQNGFNVDPVKGMVEPGHRKPISFCWVPPSIVSLKLPVIVTSHLTVKGDITKIYKIILLASVVSS
ncbi:cilia- and flagella-associated protein 74 isoform X2 [Rhinatrema bivittatum]|nr:cilia- and flagella-associated protein 74 isoform X2 [Rhinatrema bivittatum]